VFWAQKAGKQVCLEVLLDNVPWKAGTARLQEIDWPWRPDYFQLRLFLVLLPPAGHAAAFLPEGESVESGMRELLAVAEEQPQASDPCWFQALTAANVAPAVAERLIAFAPMAFVEVALGGVQHPTEYRLVSGVSAGPPQLLASEPAYVVAKREAVRISATSEGKAAFQNLALRSGRIKATKDLLNGGSKLEDIVVGQPLVLLGRFSPPRLLERSQTPPSKPEPPPAGQPRRPWWKFR
jgi:hypothetical protein